MSDKPKIYAHCKAGCLWETAHKSDVDEAKTTAKKAQNSVDNLRTEEWTFKLENGRKVKKTICVIKSEKITSTFSVILEERAGDTFTYVFEEGMTWRDWVNSEYNTDEFYIGTYDGDEVVYSFPDEVIVANEPPYHAVAPDTQIDKNIGYSSQLWVP